MMFPVPEDDWRFCQDENCSAPDRVYGKQARFLARMWLEQLRADPFRIQLVRDLVRSEVPLSLFRAVDSTLAKRVEAMLISGQLHLHMTPMETQGGAGEDDQEPSPAPSRPARNASPPAPVIDPPSFAHNANLSAQAAALAAAAASGTPFCLE